jgi:hypothetical protein
MAELKGIVKIMPKDRDRAVLRASCDLENFQIIKGRLYTPVPALSQGGSVPRLFHDGISNATRV